MSEIKLKTYKVYGRIRADIEFEELVLAKTEKTAIKLVEQIVYDRCKIKKYNLLDDEVYVEIIDE